MKPKHKIWLLLLASSALLTALAVIIAWRSAADQPSLPQPIGEPQPAATDRELKLKFRLVAEGFTQPTAIVANGINDDAGLYIVERAGRIRLVKDGKLQDEPWLDLTDRVGSGGLEQGLLGLVFHPKYVENGYFFVNYTDKAGHTHISRFRANREKAEPGSEKPILKVDQPFANHNAGDLAFGPADGYLYVPLGDGGSGGDPGNRAQNTGELLGKILRLDVDSGDPYKVPPDNPFVSRDGFRPEIWAIGFRNPWRISFDRETRDLYIGDVGQNKLEEVDFQPADSRGGQNYGWRCYEADAGFNTAGCKPAKEYVWPVAQYALREEGRCSLTGGYVYRGSRYPQLKGRYFFGDYCNGQVYTLVREPNGAWKQRLQTKTAYRISTFGQGNDGELYVADFGGGAIYQLQSE
jgi:glucose/arabinose dehydrogenase